MTSLAGGKQTPSEGQCSAVERYAMAKCAVPGCDSNPHWKGLCFSHYSKCRRSGWTMSTEDLAGFKPNYGKLHPDTKALVVSLNARGLNMKQIAEHIGVSWHTVRSWKSKGYFHFTDPMVHRTCDVAGCDRDHDSHGMCNTHLQRWIRSGRTLTLEEMAEVPVGSGQGKTKFTIEKKDMVVSLRDKGMNWTSVARKVGIDSYTLLKWRKRGLLSRNVYDAPHRPPSGIPATVPSQPRRLDQCTSDSACDRPAGPSTDSRSAGDGTERDEGSGTP